MKKIFIIFLFLNHFSFAQNEDRTWIGGYYGFVNPDTSTQFFVFSMKFEKNGTKKFHKFNKSLATIEGGNSSICDAKGDMMIFFTGEEIYNRNMEPMQGSDSLNFFPKGAYAFQATYMQNSVVLPYPKHPNQFFVVYQRKEWVKHKMPTDNKIYDISVALKTYYCLVDMSFNNGLGKVIKREQLLSRDTLSKGRLNAVRHANGRDWWVISHHFAKPEYSLFLISPKGINLQLKQKIGNDAYAVLGQTKFSPDGNYFVDFDIEGYPTQTTVYDFDRCSGFLSNPKELNFPDENACGGVAFSPNSRYLYINRYDTLYQFDMKAIDLWKSKKVVGVFDGVFFLNGFSTGMFNMQLANEGNIYIATQSGTPYMHIIKNPDLPAPLCTLQLREVMLPTLSLWTVPNYPNFALGAVKGSPCDTLNSISTQNIDNEIDIKIFPNPANDVLNISVEDINPYQIILRGVSGNIYKYIDLTGNGSIDLKDIPTGLVFVEIWSNQQLQKVQKVVIMH